MMKIREILPYILIGALAFILVQQFLAMKKLTKELSEVRESGYRPVELPDDVVTLAELEDHVMTIIARVGGDTVYVVSEQYVPPESHIEYVVSTDSVALQQLAQAQILLGQLTQQVQSPETQARIDSLQAAIINLQRMVTRTEVNFKNAGFCLFPTLGVGVDAHTDINATLGARLFFIKRFGLGVHINSNIPTDSEEDWDGSAGFFGDYRIPKLDNTAIFGSVDYQFADDSWDGMLGVHVYLR